MNRKKYYELKEVRSGVPLRTARRYLENSLTNSIFLCKSSIVTIVMNNCFLSSSKDKSYERFNSTFKTADNLIFAANIKNKSIIEQLLKIINNEIGDFASNYQINYLKAQDIKSKHISEREKFETILNSYADGYEGIYKCIASLPAISKLIINNISLPNDLVAFVHSDPKDKIAIFENDTGTSSPEVLQLFTGCYKNLRNGINHNRWKMLGPNRIKIWDANRKGQETWHKEYTLETILEQLTYLEKTIEALLLAFWVCQNNNAYNTTDVFCMPEGYYDDSALQESINDIAFDMGLFLEECRIDKQNNSVYLKVYLPDNLDISQETKIIEGSTPPRFFKVKVEVIEKSAYVEVLNFIGTICRGLFNYSTVFICIHDEKKGHILDTTLSLEELKKISKEKNQEVESKFEVLKKYTYKLTVESNHMRTF